MPMFYTPKPRQFRYQPRFYDPEKEKWEALKQKYADERVLRESLDSAPAPAGSAPSAAAPAADSAPSAAAPSADSAPVSSASADEDLAYFQRRVRDLDREERKHGLTWKDAFRKREMPTFRYQPRFQSTDESQDTGEHLQSFKKRGMNIKRRFDVSDPDYMKPIPAGRIMLYTLLVCALLYWILF